MNTSKENPNLNPNFYLIGAVASIITRLVVNPLDRYKFLLQTRSVENATIPSITRSILKNEGIRGFYKGVGPIMLCSLPKSSIYFGVLNKMKNELANNYQLGNHKVNFLSGLFAGTVTTTLLYPTDVIINRYFYNIGYTQNMYECAREAIQKKRLFRGYGITSLGIIPNHGLSYMLYCIIKENDMTNQYLNTNVSNFMSGYIASMSCQVLSYPEDVIRKNMQVNDLSLLDTIKAVTKNYTKFSNFYRGFSINLIKSPLSSGIFFMSAEFLLTFYKL